jgi:hypothetical protein
MGKIFLWEASPSCSAQSPWEPPWATGVFSSEHDESFGSNRDGAATAFAWLSLSPDSF